MFTSSAQLLPSVISLESLNVYHRVMDPQLRTELRRSFALGNYYLMPIIPAFEKHNFSKITCYLKLFFKKEKKKKAGGRGQADVSFQCSPLKLSLTL